jgi:hypothetical protein
MSATLTALPESGVTGRSISAEENSDPHRRNQPYAAREGFRIANSPTFLSVILVHLALLSDIILAHRPFHR